MRAGNAEQTDGQKRLSGVALGQGVRERRKRLEVDATMTEMRSDSADSMKQR